jgi:drug/metabolite transporter (DMT)-like permease
MKQHVLGDRLFVFQWIGVIWNVVSVILVGGTAILNESEKSVDEGETKGQALLGVLLVMAGAVVQSMQFVFEEKVMTMVGYENELETLMILPALTASKGYSFPASPFDWNGRSVGNISLHFRRLSSRILPSWG